MAECGRGCGAAVVAAQRITGEELVLDREPTGKGNWLLLGRGSGKPPLAVSAGTDPSWIERWIAAGVLYVPHMATCSVLKVPDAD